MSVTVKVDGLEDIYKQLEQFDAKLAKKYIRKAGRDAGKYLRDEVKKNTPVLQQPTTQRKAGALRDSITVKASLTKKKGLVVSVGPSKEIPYGRFLEFGTHKMAARPFMRPSFDTRSPQALTVFQDSLRASIKSNE